MKNILFLLFLSLVLFVSCQSSQVAPPASYGVLPSERQLNWQELEIISIVHFGLNTFTDEEWGFGDVDPKKFAPTDFNADEIVETAKAAGIKGLIFVAKHHDGFALWPTETTEYNITKSPWKEGKGDMVKAFEEACRARGMQFGIYCSPWDRNSAAYGEPAYIDMYRAQLKELYAGYGELFESWHDGANGGDGYYGGAKETRTIDRATYYDWDSTWQITREMQPGAVIFSDAGWDVRWVGNEKGYAADTTWETFTPQGIEGTNPTPGNVQYQYSPVGTRDGEFWIPAECDVPLRPGWFYTEKDEGKEKTVDQLFTMYLHSVGRAGNLNLGLAPDRRGLLSTNDTKTLKAFGAKIEKTFAENLADGATLEASNIRGKDDKKYGPGKLLDGDRYSYWATDDEETTPELVVHLDGEKEFDIIQIRENIKLGQRIESLAVDGWEKGEWKPLATATGIGANRLIKLPNAVRTDKVRLRVTASPVCVALSEFGLYKEH